MNNGTCIDGVNGFTCNCSREFGGDRCEIGWENIAFCTNQLQLPLSAFMCGSFAFILISIIVPTLSTPCALQDRNYAENGRNSNMLYLWIELH